MYEKSLLDNILVSYIIPDMKKHLVILDTNVLLSGLKSKNGLSYNLLQRLSTEEFDIAISVPLVLEYEAVLKRQLDRAIFSDRDIDDFLNYICGIGKKTKIFYLWRPFLKDPFDDHVLEVAFSANCEFIVTFNLKDFNEARSLGIEAITPYEFLKKLGGEQ
jgi:putative PIN family toxin of toxin-antitoxin system